MIVLCRHILDMKFCRRKSWFYYQWKKKRLQFKATFICHCIGIFHMLPPTCARISSNAIQNMAVLKPHHRTCDRMANPTINTEDWMVYARACACDFLNGRIITLSLTLCVRACLFKWYLRWPKEEPRIMLYQLISLVLYVPNLSI